LVGAAWYARMMRSSTLDILSTDYVRTPRAKGRSMPAVILRHVLPNALNPIITIIRKI
jgi:peptide/nickel transport system permease protein